MSFLNQFYPASKLAFLSCGYLFISCISFDLSVWKFSFFSIFILLFSFCTGYTKVFAICLGISLGFFQNYYFNNKFPSINFDKDLLSNIKNDKEVEIFFKKEVKKNYYEVEINLATKTISVIAKRTKKDIHFPDYSCNSSLISIKKALNNQEYFRFLEPYSYLYIQFPEHRCILKSERIDKRKEFKKKVEDLLTKSQITDYANDIAMGLFFGDASYLDSEFKERVKEGGILHLFAASGLHIGVFIGFIYFLAKRVWFLNYYTEKIIPLLIAFSYLYLLSFPISLLRAYIFTSILLLGTLFFRKIKSIDLILISASLIYFLDKENFLTLSFNLSYSAVCGILFLKNSLDKLLFGQWKNLITENITISISASLGTYPVLLYYFKSFSFGSIFLNLLLVPLTSILLPLLYISILTQYSHDFLFQGFLESIFEKINNNFCSKEPVLELLWKFSNSFGEIFWIYSELLLRCLAFLSDRMSESVGFFRKVENSYYFHLGLYICLGLILIIFFILLDFKRFSKKRKFLSILSTLLILLFFLLGYILFPETQNRSHYSKNISAASDYFLIKEKKSIYLGGICKYSQFQIQKILKQNFCNEDIDSIYIENETCLAMAAICKKDTISAKIYTTKKMPDWEKTYSYIEFKTNTEKRKFPSLRVFYPHLDSLAELQKSTREEKGNILLLFAYKLNDNAKDWNANKNLLGINPDWNFITPDEL